MLYDIYSNSISYLIVVASERIILLCLILKSLVSGISAMISSFTRDETDFLLLSRNFNSIAFNSNIMIRFFFDNLVVVSFCFPCCDSLNYLTSCCKQ